MLSDLHFPQLLEETVFSIVSVLRLGDHYVKQSANTCVSYSRIACLPYRSMKIAFSPINNTVIFSKPVTVPK